MYKLSNLSKEEVKERKERQRQRKEERKSTSTASTSRHVPFTPLCSKEEAWGGGGASNLPPEPTTSEAIYDPNFIRGRSGRRFKCMIKDPWELVLMKTIEYEEHVFVGASNMFRMCNVIRLTQGRKKIPADDPIIWLCKPGLTSGDLLKRLAVKDADKCKEIIKGRAVILSIGTNDVWGPYRGWRRRMVRYQKKSANYSAKQREDNPPPATPNSHVKPGFFCNIRKYRENIAGILGRLLDYGATHIHLISTTPFRSQARQFQEVKISEFNEMNNVLKQFAKHSQLHHQGVIKYINTFNQFRQGNSTNDSLLEEFMGRPRKDQQGSRKFDCVHWSRKGQRVVYDTMVKCFKGEGSDGVHMSCHLQANRTIWSNDWEAPQFKNPAKATDFCTKSAYLNQTCCQIGTLHE